MCKLTKNLPIQAPGGCWIFRIQKGGATTKQTGKQTFRKANLTFIAILPINNFLTDIKIRYIQYYEKIVSYIISQWYV